MSESRQLVYEFNAGLLGILFLVICCTMAGTTMLLLLTGRIEGTTEHPILGASIVSIVAVVVGIALGGWSSRTVIDRDTNLVTHSWSVFGYGITRSLSLSQFSRVIVRRWLRINGRIRKKVILAGAEREIDLATFYTLKGARKEGEQAAAFCQLPYVYDDQVPSFWPT